MSPELAEESRRLAASWMQHDDEMLRDYLVSGVQDPWLNGQSMQARHFLIERVCGRSLPGVAEHEVRFVEAVRWLWDGGKRDGDVGWFEAVRHALQRGADDAEGAEVSRSVLDEYARLPREIDGVVVPNYVQAACESGLAGGTFASARPGFAGVWKGLLDPRPAAGLTVLEPACGSANDYRLFEAFGLARHLDYVGFDLCERNIANARAMFPGARFDVGNAFEIGHPDRSFDCVVVHDLFEHLSPEGLPVALNEVARVTRGGLFIGFFQMHEDAEHLVRPVEDYHVNRLSLVRVREFLAARGFRTQAVHVDSWIRSFLGGREAWYEEWAYSVLGWR